MNPQNAAVNLQGGSGLGLGSASGATGYYQPAAGNLQLASGGSTLGQGRLTLASGQQALQSTSGLQAQYSDQTNQINQLLASLRAQQQAYAPPLNLSDIYNQASSSAQGAVNPYYTKQLQDFQAQQAADKLTQQQQTQTNIKNLQDQLTNTLQGNAISGQRTSQDVLNQEQQIGIKADQTQQDQGTQFDQARIAQAKQLATQGLTSSGLGALQVQNSQDTRNTQESRQAADTKQQVQQQELLKSRTFEDLARSGELATQSEGKGESQATFDLNKYIQGQGTALQNEQDTLEQQRLARVGQETQTQARLLINNFINSISNPAQRQAAIQAYGGY